ncbi:PIG-L family deacetylase [Gordonia insulae]|uniref:1D-myo-inositol 2-acetamido-2-deoxy-alpha-D-glucopyranoside deacetylase n=1 Tax=Gordonia insulae TaxID=2420509 RepID=A0A3G8JHM2_9ACTN|nr:PIG-L family deacetylase [Gordonia insulae]AZG44641.1 1D-myo-inositol 2-acetamido-2-deoxy-alpha-D-glucopyranoside deacetylase [Gordonia insulae]
MPPPRLLFVHAHPDDESLWTGGAIARHVARGGDADLIMCTWAEGTWRHAELIDAARELGLPRPPIMLGYADDRVPESAPESQRFCTGSFDEQVRTLTQHIRRLRPDAIVTYDAIGIYGHPDHIHAHRLASCAADAAASPRLYRSEGDAWQTRSIYFATIAEWMVDDVRGDLFASTPRDYLPGTPESAIDLTLDVMPWRDRKAAGIRAHKTELTRSRTMQALMAMPPERRSRLLGTENFIRRDLVPDGVDLG